MHETLLVFPRTRYPSGDPPLGVAYLASCLRAAGHQARIFDATFRKRPFADFARELIEHRPRLVAISTLTSMLDSAAQMARIAAKVLPESVVILGGPHPTVERESAARLPGVSAICMGEGERALPALLNADLDWRGIPGFGHVEEGHFVSNGCAQPVDDLDDVPFPAWDLLDMPRYLRLWYHLDAVGMGLRGTSIIASRGCPFNCAYCQPTLRTIFGRQIRRRSVGNVVAELAELKGRFGIDGVMWLDDTFLLDRAWMRELCGEMIGARLGLVWGCNVRADVVDCETLGVMKEAGLRIIHLGVESASQRILDEVYQKGITLDQVRSAVALAKDLGLCARGYFMLGAPTETEEEARATVELACSLPLDDATFSITTPLPHTHLWDMTRQLVGLEMTDMDYYKVPAYRSAQVLPPEKLVRLKREAYLRFYLGRKRFWRTVRSVCSPMGLQKTLLKLMRF